MNYSLALIYRIMIDVDNIIDVNYMLKLNSKPSFCDKMRDIFTSN